MRKNISYLLSLMACCLLAIYSYEPGETFFPTTNLLLNQETQTNDVGFFQQDGRDVARDILEANSLFFPGTPPRITASAGQNIPPNKPSSHELINPFHAGQRYCPTHPYPYLKESVGTHSFATGRSADYYVYSLRRLLI